MSFINLSIFAYSKFSVAKEDRDYITPDMGSTINEDGTSSSIFNLLRGKKFLAAVVTGSSIGTFIFFLIFARLYSVIFFSLNCQKAEIFRFVVK